MFIIFISSVLTSDLSPLFVVTNGTYDMEDLLLSKIMTWTKSVIIHHVITLSNEVKSHWGKSILLYLHFGESKQVQDMASKSHKQYETKVDQDNNESCILNVGKMG